MSVSKSQFVHDISTPIAIIELLATNMATRSFCSLARSAKIQLKASNDLRYFSSKIESISKKAKETILNQKVHDHVLDIKLFNEMLSSFNAIELLASNLNAFFKIKAETHTPLTAKELSKLERLISKLKYLANENKSSVTDYVLNINPSINKQSTLTTKLSGVSLQKNLNILVVEDEEIFQMLAKDCLSSHYVDVSYNGLEAIHSANEKSYDLIFMDLSLPKCNGVEATKKIREKSETPIIGLTSQPLTKKEEATLLTTGFDYFLKKPLQLQSLAALPFGE